MSTICRTKTATQKQLNERQPMQLTVMLSRCTNAGGVSLLCNRVILIELASAELFIRASICEVCSHVCKCVQKINTERTRTRQTQHTCKHANNIILHIPHACDDTRMAITMAVRPYLRMQTNCNYFDNDRNRRWRRNTEQQPIKIRTAAGWKNTKHHQLFVQSHSEQEHAKRPDRERAVYSIQVKV